MTIIKKKEHKGLVLNVSDQGFDSSATTFSSLFYDEGVFYLFYTGSSDIKWSSASIGLAISSDGLHFKKLNEINPILNAENIGYEQAVTPVVFKAKEFYYMVFAGKPKNGGRRICIAYSEDLKGPWRFLKELIKPEYFWEGNDIDLGPSVVKQTEDEVLLYYSNVSNKGGLWKALLGPRYWLRMIGILKLRVRSPTEIEAYRYERNPLKHLNGPKGVWNESLFCPGCIQLGERYYLLPAASTYSVGFPYKQYIGLIEDFSPFFNNPTDKEILINGPEEKKMILPNIKSEIALDTPSPLIKGDELWLYYAVMDRADGIWKTALSIFSISQDK
jgi:hypothetical protein